MHARATSCRLIHRIALVGTALLALFAGTSMAQADEQPSGRQIYLQKCAGCHGADGEGVMDKHDEALYGNRPLAELVKVIDETMPEEKAEECTGEEAQAVARYIYETFYTAAARAKNNPPRIELSRLTARQYENTIADLVGEFIGRRDISDRRGLEADYYNDRGFNRRERKIERVDPMVDFNFGAKSPHEQIKDNEFSIRWRGSVVIDDSGDYEFGVRTENGFQLWINDKDKPLIDGYVSAGPEPVRREGEVRLLAGRAYPLELEWFKYKDKTASVQLMWKPPGKTWRVIPQRHLSPDDAQPSLVITTPLPPDDSSYGYPRGTDVSQAWDEATTYAAVEVANRAVQHLEQLAKVKKDVPDRRRRLEQFCETFVERAFRRPLSDAQRELYVASHFAGTDDLEVAVKRCVVMALKSPYFLYLNLPRESALDDYDVASRLSFALWDCPPDEPLRQAASQGRLQSRDQIAEQARRMIQDPRAKAKLRGFFAHWLQLDHTDHLAKDAEAFAGYDDELIADLRTSLELFIDEVLDSESTDYRQLLLADYWYANERMAKFYELTIDDNERGFAKIQVDSQQRAGVATHPYLLAANSYHETTSPIHRGVFASRRLLSRPLNPPPNAILFEDAKFDPHLTMREKVTELTKAETCMACHSIINPLGFSLENFDAVGRFRTMEKEKPIDAASVYTTAGGETIRLASGRDLAAYAAGSEQAQIGFVEQLFHHAVKQPAAAYGEDTLKNLHQSFVDSQYNIQALVVEIAITAATPQ